jgi:hypothetical protein
VFHRAIEDGKLPHTSTMWRTWSSPVSAADAYGDRSFAEVAGRDIAALVDGYSAASAAS